jgi:hypothetical protein
MSNKVRGRPFNPGESGNPLGRPVGSRNQFSAAFIGDMQASWAQHGPALAWTMRKSPSAPISEPIVMTTCPPYLSIDRPTLGATSPATKSPTGKPPIAKEIDQPRSAAINGTISTGV